MTRAPFLGTTRAIAVWSLLVLAALASIPVLLLIPNAASAYPQLAAIGPLAATAPLLLGWLVFVGLLAIGLAVWLSGQIARPVQSLTLAANEVASGHFQGELAPSGPSEVRELGRAFARMAKALDASFTVLSAERDRLDAVLRHMADGILIVDADNVVSLANPAAARILGVDQESAVGRRLATIVREHEVIDVVQEAIADEERRDHAVSIQRASPRRYLRAVATRSGEGRSAQALLLLQDLTEVRRLETVRRDFLANLSHELRTPISAIKAMVETLQDGAIDDPVAGRDFLDRVQREIDGLSQLVAELLQLARIESGQADLRPARLSVADLITRAVERLYWMAERAQVELAVELPDSLPEVRADEERVGQVLVNLVHNAVKFTPAGGRVAVGAHVSAREVLFCVRDTGVGIPPEDLPRIFERFYKADKARSSGGTGLGLAIAKHIVQAHGGRIWAESAGPGHGAEFFFTLPLA